MSRNKYPEETVNLILDVSQRLFIEKGYDNTTIQDIIDELGGLTKGAIYHHFSSKQRSTALIASQSLTCCSADLSRDSSPKTCGCRKISLSLIAAAQSG